MRDLDTFERVWAWLAAVIGLGFVALVIAAAVGVAQTFGWWVVLIVPAAAYVVVRLHRVIVRWIAHDDF